MIIPILCFNCGKTIADTYRYYQEKVREKKLAQKKIDESIDINKVLYLTKEFDKKTPEGEVLDEIGMTNQCCRMIFLAHVDIE